MRERIVSKGQETLHNIIDPLRPERLSERWRNRDPQFDKMRALNHLSGVGAIGIAIGMITNTPDLIVGSALFGTASSVGFVIEHKMVSKKIENNLRKVVSDLEASRLNFIR